MYKQHITTIKIGSTEAKEPFIGSELALTISRNSASNSKMFWVVQERFQYVQSLSNLLHSEDHIWKF